jgi:hypothetical protein
MMYNLVIGNTLGDTLHKIALVGVNGPNRNLYECQLDHYQDVRLAHILICIVLWNRNGTERFFCLKGRPSVVRDA